MKNIILLLSLLALISCSSPSDTEPTRSKVVAPEALVVEGSGCGDIVRLNDTVNGEAILIRAELTGCVDGVAFLAQTQNVNGTPISSYRKPSDCDFTEVTISFSHKGETLNIGLFPCGSAVMSGVAYKLTVTQNGVSKTIETKVGSVIKYSTQ